jgi:pyruvate kinase
VERKTKIVATIGPASRDRETLERPADTAKSAEERRFGKARNYQRGARGARDR